jgi:4-hydroxybenzoate polyprenyltransferase
MFLFGYSYAKRFTALSHFWLGAALGLAPIFAWVAIQGDAILYYRSLWCLRPAVLLGGAVMSWVAGFDIIYACQDAGFDRDHGLHSIPALLGVKWALRIAAACHAAMVVLLAVIPLTYPFMVARIWWIGTAAVAVLLAYEHWLVKPDDLKRVNVAFFNVNAIVSIWLLGIGVTAMWLSYIHNPLIYGR